MLGKTNSPADFTSLLADVTERLFGRLPDATWVCPGTAATPRSVPSVRTSVSGAHGW